MTIQLQHVAKQLVILKTLYNNSRNYCHLKISCPKVQYHGYKIIISRGIYRYLCDKLVSGVNLVTIMTVKTFTAGAQPGMIVGFCCHRIIIMKLPQERMGVIVGCCLRSQAMGSTKQKGRNVFGFFLGKCVRRYLAVVGIMENDCSYVESIAIQF